MRKIGRNWALIDSFFRMFSAKRLILQNSVRWKGNSLGMNRYFKGLHQRDQQSIELSIDHDDKYSRLGPLSNWNINSSTKNLFSRGRYHFQP